MIKTERIKPHQGELLRELRRRALQDAPNAFLENYDDVSKHPIERWEASAKKHATSPHSANFFGFLEGELLGMVGAYVSEGEPDIVNLCAMWVAPEARQKGLGQALVERVLIWAKDAQAKKVCLWVNTENVTAKKFYRSCGFNNTEVTQVFSAKPDSVNEKMEYIFSGNFKAPKPFN